ncbi:Tar ligand binding domain-containing protein, partial [Caballeronia sp. GACF4]|uniref:Tar ligand binding domain-containing protein n=1 Tax=Caballeronia sp. GACF4 TaxID=2921763 RepID=UPI0020299352
MHLRIAAICYGGLCWRKFIRLITVFPPHADNTSTRRRPYKFVFRFTSQLNNWEKFKMKSLSIRARLALTMILLGVLLSLSVGIGLYGMATIKASARDVSLSTLPSVNALGVSDVYLNRARVLLDRFALDRDGTESADLRARAEKALADSDEWYKKYDVIPRGADEDVLAKDVVEGRTQMRKALEGFGAAIEKRDQTEIIRYAQKDVPDAYNRTSDAFKKLKEFQLIDAARQDEENDSSYATVRTVGFISLVVGIA